MNPGHVLASMEVARTEQKGMQLVQDGIILASKGIMAAIDQNIQQFLNSYIHNDINRSY